MNVGVSSLLLVILLGYYEVRYGVAFVVVAFYPSSHSFFVYEIQLRVIQTGRVGRYLPVRAFARGFLTNIPRDRQAPGGTWLDRKYRQIKR